MFRNDGNFRFTDVTEKAGVADRGLTLSLAAADYDADGDQDIYLANDFGRNVLYENRGDGTFHDVAKETGTLASSFAQYRRSTTRQALAGLAVITIT